MQFGQFKMPQMSNLAMPAALQKNYAAEASDAASAKVENPMSVWCAQPASDDFGQMTVASQYAARMLRCAPTAGLGKLHRSVKSQVARFEWAS